MAVPAQASAGQDPQLRWHGAAIHRCACRAPPPGWSTRDACSRRWRTSKKRNLGEPPSLSDIAEIVDCSPWHFHRAFHALVGETIAGFIRRLRLQRAAQRLQRSTWGMLAIGIEAGYRDQSAFTRAFRSSFGCTPTRWRDQRRDLLATLRRVGRLAAAGSAVRDLPDQRIAFVRTDYGRIPQAWEQLRAWGQRHGLARAPAAAIAHDDPTMTPIARTRYDACLFVDRSMRPSSGIAITWLPGGLHIVVEHRGLRAAVRHLPRPPCPLACRRMASAPRCAELRPLARDA